MTTGIMARLLAGETIQARADDELRHVLKIQMRPVFKSSGDLMIAYGWASLAEVDGKPVVDSDNEIFTEADLDSYARQFVLGRHGGKVMHSGEREAELVESMMFTKEKQDILGIDLGKTGWWVGLKYHRPEVWERIKSGELAMFSLMGYAIPREPGSDG